MQLQRFRGKTTIVDIRRQKVNTGQQHSIEDDQRRVGGGEKC